MSLSILFQDDYFVAINKPSGLLVHRTSAAEDTRQFALQELRNQLKKWIYPVHRLDQPTAGVLLFGLRQDATKKMSCLFRERKLSKHYIAIVRGHSPDYELLCEGFKKEKKTKDDTIYPAITEYERLATATLPVKLGPYPAAHYSLLKIKLHTGRIHQIRRHLKQIQHPIINDRKYGDWRHNKFMMKKQQNRSLHLLAYELQFTHPFTKENIQIKAPMPPDMQQLFDLFGWEESLIEQPNNWGRIALPDIVDLGFGRFKLEEGE